MFVRAQLNGIPITIILAVLPELLKLVGTDPELCDMAASYCWALIPCLWLEAMMR